MKHATVIGLCAALSGIAAPYHAAADPVTVTSGFLLSTGRHETSPRSELAGTRDFTASGHVVVGIGAGALDAMDTCDSDHLACLPGQTVSLGGFLWAQGPDPGFYDAVVTLDGVEYRDFGIDDGYNLLIELGGSFVLPSFANGAGMTVSAPFVLGGFFYDSLQSLTTPLMGRGIATLWLTPSAFDGMPYWLVQQIRYDVQDTAPIPEPATLVLVGSGLLGMVAAARRRRQSVI